MIEGTLALASLFVLIALFVVKMYAVSQKGSLYPPIGIFIGFAVGWLFWLLLLMSLSATFLIAEEIETPSGDIYTISSNDYESFSLYLNFSNLLIGLISIFTVVETFFIMEIFSSIKKPLKAREARYALPQR